MRGRHRRPHSNFPRRCERTLELVALLASSAAHLYPASTPPSLRGSIVRRLATRASNRLVCLLDAPGGGVRRGRGSSAASSSRTCSPTACCRGAPGARRWHFPPRACSTTLRLLARGADLAFTCARRARKLHVMGIVDDVPARREAGPSASGVRSADVRVPVAGACYECDYESVCLCA